MLFETIYPRFQWAETILQKSLSMKCVDSVVSYENDDQHKALNLNIHLSLCAPFFLCSGLTAPKRRKAPLFFLIVIYVVLLDRKTR